MASIRELLQFGKEQLEQNGNAYAKYERKVLLEEVLGCNYMYMLINGEEEVPPEKEDEYKAKLNRRLQHYPLQYLLGYAHFMDYTFFVNEDVLIPRSDTEILVECVDDIIKKHEAAKKEGDKTGSERYSVIDLCCGTGCIGISLKLYHQALELVLSDISEKALHVAKRNLEKYNVEAELICGSLFDGIDVQADMIVSNPPYIESRMIDTLMPEVREYEPVLALDGGESGLDFYQKITAQAREYLKDGGWLLFEIGYNQNEAVQKLMRECGFWDVTGRKDYAGLDRVVMGHL